MEKASLAFLALTSSENCWEKDLIGEGLCGKAI